MLRWSPKLKIGWQPQDRNCWWSDPLPRKELDWTLWGQAPNLTLHLNVCDLHLVSALSWDPGFPIWYEYEGVKRTHFEVFLLKKLDNLFLQLLMVMLLWRLSIWYVTLCWFGHSPPSLQAPLSSLCPRSEPEGKRPSFWIIGYDNLDISRYR